MEFAESDEPLPSEYNRLVGTKTGLVSNLAHSSLDRGGPRAGVGAVDHADLGWLGAGHTADIEAGGKGLGARETLTSTVGEFVERYCLHWPREDALVEASYDEMASRGEVPDFECLAAYGQADLEPGDHELLDPLSRDTVLPWVAGTNLLTGDTSYVPAHLVWNRVGELADYPNAVVGTSNGAAAGPTLEAAVLSGLAEVVERDAFVRTWCEQTPPPRVDVAATPDLAARRDRLLPSDYRSLSVFEYDGTVDVPAYGAAIVDDRDRYPKFAIGGSADFDPLAAATDAMVEAAQAFPYLEHVRTDYDLDAIDPARIWNFTENTLLYARPENFEHVSFFVEGEETALAPSEDVADDLAAYLDRLDAAGCTPVAVEVTTPDVREVGIRVVRVVVPELVPFPPSSLPPADHPRLAEVDVPEMPHPYP
ncbi:YcaO-like family protein [Halorussus gelatinilyticus]|uniref:YcaO-like family protein n=1 Tax=Halorussus gelatinilyticus TaxID=2937524 RepID=A0A8U0ILN5_9EURY|nr:YcaO-like family protein [Halorussus gelatinilyticus]UPW02053.1 YcaO-like family protein [Halorussus gelatinilyticus]